MAKFTLSKADTLRWGILTTIKKPEKIDSFKELQDFRVLVRLANNRFKTIYFQIAPQFDAWVGYKPEIIAEGIYNGILKHIESRKFVEVYGGVVGFGPDTEDMDTYLKRLRESLLRYVLYARHTSQIRVPNTPSPPPKRRPGDVLVELRLPRGAGLQCVPLHLITRYGDKKGSPTGTVDLFGVKNNFYFYRPYHIAPQDTSEAMIQKEFVQEMQLLFPFVREEDLRLEFFRDEDEQFQLNRVHDVVINGIVPDEHPDYPSAYIAAASYKGKPMSDEQIKDLPPEFVKEQVSNYMGLS